MTLPNAQVSDVEDEIVDEPSSTDQVGDGVANATPGAPQPVDVEALKAEYEKRLAATQQDVNNVKSALQSREAALEKQWKQREDALKKQLHDIRIQGMDDNQRKQYEASLATEEAQSLQQRLADAERSNQELAEMFNAQKFFLGQGVPATSLVLDQGYDALVNSGWQAISQEVANLRAQVANPNQKKTPAPLKSAPNVLTDKAAPSKGNTWENLRKRYGSEEQVYQLIEAGQLDPSILPS